METADTLIGIAEMLTETAGSLTETAGSLTETADTSTETEDTLTETETKYTPIETEEAMTETVDTLTETVDTRTETVDIRTETVDTGPSQVHWQRWRQHGHRSAPAHRWHALECPIVPPHPNLPILVLLFTFRLVRISVKFWTQRYHAIYSERSQTQVERL